MRPTRGDRMLGVVYSRTAQVVLVLIGLCFTAEARVLSSYAIVNDDATLTVSGQRINLDGVHIPQTTRYCRTWLRPVRCAPRAALALDFKIQGFVYCVLKNRNRDRSVDAQCFVNRTHSNPGEDLGAYLIERGWAVALPDAPFEYDVLERVARHQHRGIWGISVDRIR